MKQVRWGEKTRQASQGLGRERIIAAAIDCYEKLGMSQTTLDDIAKEAHISRRTVYRYFDSKGSIIQAVMDDQAQALLQEIKGALLEYERDSVVYMKQCVMYFVKRGPQEPGHQLLLGNKNALAAGEYYFSSKTLYELLYAIVKQPFEYGQQHKQLDENLTIKELIHYIGRMVFSFVQFPVPEETLEKFLQQFLSAAICAKK